MPDIFEQTYRDWGYDIHQELDLSRLDPSYRVHWVDDNVSETIATDRSQNKDFFEQQET